MKQTAGLLLAAGASTRMGMPKQLLPVGDQCLIDLALGAALESNLDIVILVLGFQADDIKAALKTDIHHRKLKIIENTRYSHGISTSIIAGLSEIEDHYDHVMIILADMPHVDAGTINNLLLRYHESRLPLGAVNAKGKRSHPVLVNRLFYRELHQLLGDVGAKDLFLRYADQVCLVEAEKGYDDSDIDTPEDYRDFKRSLTEMDPHSS